ncbi:EAL domain-containing protein [Chromobacterium sp. Panama]|uniref:EAL domain-containing response regulator n=1 Tax=Chromobacterium sp. Panama TaxID=2161826 RepID=UPI001E321899|nr:EAL domain-containing response regulator [Chromobacterium sp. Panama]
MDVSELNVLVVDDHPIERAHVKSLLSKAGVDKAQLCDTSRAAAEICCQEGVDLLICDIMMPDGGGSELVLMLREAFVNGRLASLPVLAWLSSVDSIMLFSHMRMAQEAGFECVKVVHKPLVMADCQSVLRDTLAVVYKVGALPAAPALGEDLLNSATLRHAIQETEEFQAWYQPQLSLQDGRVLGAEALIRWVRPDVGVMSPSRLMPRVAELGLEGVLFDKVVAQAAALQQRLLQADRRLPIAVNASAAVLSQTDLPLRLEQYWRKQGLVPKLLTVELAENVNIEQSVELMVSLNRLRAAGFGLAIDDYGVGISTLRMLADIPFSEIKLDRSFVQNMQGSEVCYELVRSAIQLGGRLGMTVVAEGIETMEQKSMLQFMGCLVGQGYGLFKPMHGEELLALLQSTRPERSSKINAERVV